MTERFPGLIGLRVQVHPATDAWMRGDRYGEITAARRLVSTGEVYVLVKLDKSGRRIKVREESVDYI